VRRRQARLRGRQLLLQLLRRRLRGGGARGGSLRLAHRTRARILQRRHALLRRRQRRLRRGGALLHALQLLRHLLLRARRKRASAPAARTQKDALRTDTAAEGAGAVSSCAMRVSSTWRSITRRALDQVALRRDSWRAGAGASVKPQPQDRTGRPAAKPRAQGTHPVAEHRHVVRVAPGGAAAQLLHRRGARALSSAPQNCPGV
jgi:hypothetical protein